MAASSWEEKYNAEHDRYRLVQDQLQSERQVNERQKGEIELLAAKINKLTKSRSPTKRMYDADMIADIKAKGQNDPDAIKLMVKNKEIGINDKIWVGRTLLVVSAWYGAYDLVNFCINQGADLSIKDNVGRTALDWSRVDGYYNIEQLLLFAELNVSVGADIKHTAEAIHKQNGIIDNILNGLQEIGPMSKQVFEKTMLELMIKTISKKAAFSDNLLNFCWNYVCRDNQDPLLSELWDTISTVCKDIIKNGDKRNWYWLKKCLLPSTVCYIFVFLR